jgi:hypothetical protein
VRHDSKTNPSTWTKGITAGQRPRPDFWHPTGWDEQIAQQGERLAQIEDDRRYAVAAEGGPPPATGDI